MAINAVNNYGSYDENNPNTSKPVQSTEETVKVLGDSTNEETEVTRIGKSGVASDKMMQEAINEANNKLRISNRHCQFKYEKDINRVSVKLIDEDTGEVIREIPSEETLDMIRRLKEMTGLLVDEQR